MSLTEFYFHSLLSSLSGICFVMFSDHYLSRLSLNSHIYFATLKPIRQMHYACLIGTTVMFGTSFLNKDFY